HSRVAASAKPRQCGCAPAQPGCIQVFLPSFGSMRFYWLLRVSIMFHCLLSTCNCFASHDLSLYEPAAYMSSWLSPLLLSFLFLLHATSCSSCLVSCYPSRLVSSQSILSTFQVIAVGQPLVHVYQVQV